MPDIKDSVGEGGKNNVHDVALVQAMLRVVKDAKGATYLTANYTGTYGADTKSAIIALQNEYKLAEPPAPPGTPPAKPLGAGVGAGVAKLDKQGLVEKNSATLKKLVALLPETHKEIRIIENTKTVYLPDTPENAASSQKDINADIQLDVNFRGKVALLVQQMYENHKIALWIAPQGGRRTFEQQANLPPNVTKAGPGESNHNFGRAVDIGFKNFKWVSGDGKIVKDNWWLSALSKVSADKATQLWEARNAIAVNGTPGLFGIGAWDIIHLQAYSDANIRMSASLVTLLNAAGKTKWVTGGGKPHNYKSDLGIGGAKFSVGTSKEIWKGQATVTKAMIAQARTEILKKDAIKKDPQLKNFKPVTEADIKDEDVAKIKTALQKDFQLADQNWKTWKPVP